MTRGDADLRELTRTLQPFHQVIVFDNLKGLTLEGYPDRKVYGRYLAAMKASTEYIYTQDDDCLINVARLCKEYEPGELLCNVLPTHQPFYQSTGGIQLVGWGAIFPKSMIDFSPYLAKYPEDELFDRECDRVFTWLNRDKTRVVDIGVEHLPSAHGKDRMGAEARHGADLMEIRKRLASL